MGAEQSQVLASSPAALAFEEKMRQENMSDAAVRAFLYNYSGLVSGKSCMLPDAEIEAVLSLPKLEEIVGQSSVDANAVLKKTVVLKLNGGLGTGMGLEKAKSLLVVREELTFLDFIVQQVKHMRATFGPGVKFALMNSFATSEDTLAFLKERFADVAAEAEVELIQNKSPKVSQETLLPATYAEDPEKEWCPPGHGDLYPSLLGSGMLDKLLAQGYEYMFVSNSDNLGATLDLELLKYFAGIQLPFLMEVCERTAADKKGGHLALKQGQLLLREAAMCPEEDEASFQDITKHKYFNTNNLWVNLKQLKAEITANGGLLPLPLIKNKKTVNPRDDQSTPVFQLETAMGSAIECFKGAAAVVVPRSRFAPVKTCNDLLGLRSDAYRVTADSRLVLAAQRQPVISLDSKYYKKVDKMEALVEAAPSLVGCEKLKVTGPVKFVAGTVIHGAVEVTNSTQEPKVLPAGDYDNQSVTL